MNTFSEIQRRWQQVLSDQYPSEEGQREIAALFRIALEDRFGLSNSEQLLQRDQPQPAETVQQLEQVLARLLTGEPLQHITGFTYFDDLKIRVSPDVLIPRPETEELVHLVAGSVPEAFNGTIIDWCTGSGCIALALKNRFPKARVIGYDQSEAALEMARSNAAGLQLKVEFAQQDALATETDPPKVQIIVSNPPYIPEKDKTGMHRNVLHYEPYMALFVPDNDALLFYRAITEKAIAQLEPGGLLFFELHEDYAEETRQMVEATQAFGQVKVLMDLSGKQRMLATTRNSSV